MAEESLDSEVAEPRQGRQFFELLRVGRYQCGAEQCAFRPVVVLGRSFSAGERSGQAREWHRVRGEEVELSVSSEQAAALSHL